MTAKLIFFIFPMLLVLLPITLYKRNSPFMVRLWLRMAYDQNTRKMAANLMTMILILFHLAYYAVFPSDKGIMISTLLLFVLFSTKRCVCLLTGIRQGRKLRWVLAILCLGLPFVPHMLSTAISLAFVLETSFFFPAEGLTDFYENNVKEQDVDKKFVEAYFK